MLSTKHLDTSSTVDPFIIHREDAIYITCGIRDNTAGLNLRLKGQNVAR